MVNTKENLNKLPLKRSTSLLQEYLISCLLPHRANGFSLCSRPVWLGEWVSPNLHLVGDTDPHRSQTRIRHFE